MDDAKAKEVAEQLGLGATGAFPLPPLRPDDEGELKAALAVVGDRLVINFGKPVAWLALTAEQAIQFATLILAKCGVEVRFAGDSPPPGHGPPVPPSDTYPLTDPPPTE